MRAKVKINKREKKKIKIIPVLFTIKDLRFKSKDKTEIMTNELSKDSKDFMADFTVSTSDIWRLVYQRELYDKILLTGFKDFQLSLNKTGKDEFKLIDISMDKIPQKEEPVKTKKRRVKKTKSSPVVEDEIILEDEIELER